MLYIFEYWHSNAKIQTDKYAFSKNSQDLTEYVFTWFVFMFATKIMFFLIKDFKDNLVVGSFKEISYTIQILNLKTAIKIIWRLALTVVSGEKVFEIHPPFPILA